MNAARDIDRHAAELGIDHLKPDQRRAVEALLAGCDVLGVLASGFGKSVVYRVAATMLDGVTVVISPLIALQHDQVLAVADTDAVTAVAIHSGLSASRTEKAWRRVADAETGVLLYLTPEQAARPEVRERLTFLSVGAVVVDEAHCIAAWGHDFRPAYLRIAEFANAVGRPPILALTATAPPPVRDEIVARLGLTEPLLVLGDVDRPGIHLSVRHHAHADDVVSAVVHDVVDLARGAGTGLVYTATRAATTQYADLFAQHDVRALAYHGGLSARDRNEVHRRFVSGDVDVVIATSAFGMGIDNPNVRFVAHAAPPDSLERYYQEFGRAGRDGESARAILHYRAEDLGLQNFFAVRRPNQKVVRTVLRAVVAATDPLPTDAITALPSVSARSAGTALDLLERVGAVRLNRGDDGTAGWVDLDSDVRAVMTRVRAAAEAEESAATSRVEMMRHYAEAGRCRRRMLLEYFGAAPDDATDDDRCGRCDSCESGRADRTAAAADSGSADLGLAPGDRVRHEQWGEGEVVSVEPDRLTAHFDEQGYRTLASSVARDRDLLKPA
ncbi:RecQ family ATP-dependent DNA helicase [Rhodococcoides kroppenstedtii]|uniref:RecQ family ATP-dependent DNA helicase n=1 Tax=Rhodococcoides kroppenstedtii TaxID=293050 RepID=UPI0036304F38